MDVIEAIRERRSVRRFREEDVPDKLLRKIVDAARRAPSGGNFQPWLSIITKDVRLKEKVRSFLGDRALGMLKARKGRRSWVNVGLMSGPSGLRRSRVGDIKVT